MSSRGYTVPRFLINFAMQLDPGASWSSFNDTYSVCRPVKDPRRVAVNELFVTFTSDSNAATFEKAETAYNALRKNLHREPFDEEWFDVMRGGSSIVHTAEWTKPVAPASGPLLPKMPIPAHCRRNDD